MVAEGWQKKKKKITLIKKNENTYMADGCQKKKKVTIF